MDILLSICLGLGLSAACGFRVFVPMLGMSIAALSGHLHLADGFDWIGTWPAFACFLTATVLEIAGYYVPWIDNFLDSIATPAAVIAGTIATASVVSDMSPIMKWSVALIAGGGIAGAIQTGTVALRGASSFTTLGFANPIIATAELGLSGIMTILAFVIPVLAMLLVVVMFVIAIRLILRRRARTVAIQQHS